VRSAGLTDTRFRLDPETASVHVEGKRAELQLIELRLLTVPCERPGHIFDRSQSTARIYADHRVVSDRTVDSHVKKLRQKLRSISATTSTCTRSAGSAISSCFPNAAER